MSQRKVNVRITIKATPRQIQHLKGYTRDLGYRRWRTILEEAVRDVIPSEAENSEMEKR